MRIAQAGKSPASPSSKSDVDTVAPEGNAEVHDSDEDACCFLLCASVFASTGRRGASPSDVFLALFSLPYSASSTWPDCLSSPSGDQWRGKGCPVAAVADDSAFRGWDRERDTRPVGMDVTLGQALISLDPRVWRRVSGEESEFIQALIRVALSAEHGGVELVFDDEQGASHPARLITSRARQGQRPYHASLASFDSQIRQKQSELEGQRRHWLG